MYIVSWNVNGLRACITKGFMSFLETENPDFLCIQETKMQEDQIAFEVKGYHKYFNSAVKKGYSGTAIFAKQKALSCQLGININEHDSEGRVITLEYENFYLVTVYTPNSQRELARLSYRMEWEEAFLGYLMELKAKKPTIVCGDLNVAHKEIDLKNPKTNRKNAGFTDEERQKMDILLNSGFVDSFRHLHPNEEGAYSWWSYMGRAREKNVGWRIDYILVSQSLANQIEEATILPQVLGSDHCPVGVKLS